MTTKLSVWLWFLVVSVCVAAPVFAQRPNPQRGDRPRPDDGLKIGQKAPTFKLKSVDGESETDLKTLLEEKPVVLIFGSYT